MTHPAPARRAARVLPLAVALGFAAVTPLLAQGTKAEREACTADAIQFCSDTIPDVDKTTVCMKKHLSELSPKCRPFVADRTDGTPPPDARPESHADRGPSDDDSAAVSRPHDDDDVSDDDSAIGNYRRSIARSCREGLIDPFTCRNTMAVLRHSE